jgi:hypothetical protein
MSIGKFCNRNVVSARQFVRRPGPHPPEIVFPEMSSR